MSSFFRVEFFLLLFIAAILGIFLCGLPLFETPGYEYALAVALTASLFSGLLSASLPIYFRRNNSFMIPTGLYKLIFRSFCEGQAIVLVMCSISVLNGFFVPFCNLKTGLLFFVLMPFFSIFFAVSVGTAIGLFVSSLIRARLLFVAFFFLTLASGFFSFYFTPAVYVFNPFAGFYPGVLYDRIIEPDFRLITYRFGTTVQSAAIFWAIASIYDSKSLTISTKLFRLRPKSASIAAFLIIVAALFQLFGSVMGHRTIRNDLEKYLNCRISSKHLNMFFSCNIDRIAAAAMAEDAEFHLQQATEYFDITPQNNIAVFVFESSEEKGRLMGASDTNVAKPWRREVYVTYSSPPHPVMRHELAHALSADFAPGPFAIAGKLNGIIPNPALIEGLATAAGGPMGDLTIHQWARAMDSLKLLPKINQLTGLGFFDLAASAAYTASGSFCDWIRKEFGPSVLTKAYKTGNFESATGKSLTELESKWKVFLNKIPLIEADLVAASARFDRKPMIRTVCVRETAKLAKQAQSLIQLNDFSSANKLLEKAYALSGKSDETKELLFRAAQEEGKWDFIRTEAKAVLSSKESRQFDKSLYSEIVLDLNISEGIENSYAEKYSDLSKTAETEERKRRLEVKAHLARTGVVYPQIFDILSLRPGARRVNALTASLIIAMEAASRPDDPVRAYLLARQFFNAEDYENTLIELTKAEDLGLSEKSQSIKTAAVMLKGDALLLLKKYKEAQIVFQALSGDSAVRIGQREMAKDKARRARFYLKK